MEKDIDLVQNSLEALGSDLRRIGEEELALYREGGWDELREALRGLPEDVEEGPSLIDKITSFEVDPNDKLSGWTLRTMKRRLKKKMNPRRKMHGNKRRRIIREYSKSRRTKEAISRGTDQWNAIDGMRAWIKDMTIELEFEHWLAMCEYAEKKYGVCLWENPRIVCFRLKAGSPRVATIDTIRVVRYNWKNLFVMDDFLLWYHGYTPLDETSS